jgi:hypothetical protein
MIIERLNKIIEKKLFDLQCSKILSTSAVNYRYREDVKIVSQVYHGAVNMYLIAIKSFLWNFGSGSVYILDDGSLTKNDKDLLIKHIPDINIKHINEIETGKCPKGGTWERLVYITELLSDSYVIQLDSDTITLSPLVEVNNAILENISFIIGNPNWPLPVNVCFLNDVVGKWDSNHVQVVSEKNLKYIQFFKEGRRYIRGCSAFTGFAKKSITKEFLEEFSIQIENQIGAAKWSEWGSEQVASNVMLASDNDTLILPWPRYQNYGFPQSYLQAFDSAALIHFIGSNRFLGRKYERSVKKFIQGIL